MNMKAKPRRRTVVVSEGVSLPYPGFSPAVRFDDWIFAAAQSAADYEGGLAEEVRGNPAMPLIGEDDRFRESHCIFDRLSTTLEAAGGKLDRSLRIDQFPTTRAIMDAYHNVRTARMSQPRPASTSVVIDGLLAPVARIGVELVSLANDAAVDIEPVIPSNVPHSLFGIVPAIKAGDFVFVAAQVATDFKTGLAPEARRNPAFWQGSEIELQTRYILRNFETVLQAAGSSLANVVKATVYLTDMNDLPRLDRVWKEAFPSDPPVRTILPASGLGVADACIEINLVALTDNGGTMKEVIRLPEYLQSPFHESTAIRAGNLLLTSGLMAADRNGLVQEARVNPHNPFTSSTTQIQTQNILERAEQICTAAGAHLRNAVRMLTAHTDLGEFAWSRVAMLEAFPEGEPATTSLKVRGPLAVPDASVMLDLWIGI
jgi:enamine deaminase RidA (YjgF/YER057c/UK114 family)